MELLMHLKYSFNRNYFLSALLLHIKEICFLSVLLVNSFSSFYQNVFQVIAIPHPYYSNISLVVAACNLILVLLTLAANWPRFAFLKPIWYFSSLVLKLFPYLLVVPLLTFSIGAALNNELLGRITGLINMFFILAYLLLHEFLNESLKFKEADYCSRRMISFPEQFIIAICIGSIQLLGSFYGCLAYLFRAIFVLASLYGTFEYKLVQRLQIFYALLYGYIALVTLMCKLKLIDSSTIEPVANSLFLILGGAFVSWIFSAQLTVHIGQRLLGKAQWGGERGQGEFTNDREQNQLHEFQNEIKSLVEVILQKWKYEEGKQNDYQHYWKVYNERVFVHKLRCEEKRCICKTKKLTEKQLNEEVYVFDLLKRIQGVGALLGKEGRLKVLNINLLVEIAKKPLKGYYQLISLKREKNKLALKLQIEDLVIRARECFDQIYYKNKVQNQQLDLMKTIQCEEIMTSLEDQIRSALLQSSSFLEIFTYSTVKMTQVQTQSQKLFEIKKSIERKLEKMIWEMGESGTVALALFVFYRLLEVYRSRENELKKLGGQQSLKKRLMQKAQGETVADEQGIIYIDLVEERGRIKKITLAISQFFGYSKEDMIGFNINLFMPSLFGKYHAKFLSNFIDKGRIKLLKERNRVVFGKNKKKFIFPINIKLKTQHLQHEQFGASAIISKIDTSSEYMIAGNHARIEEISEGIYRRIFGKTLREEVGKANKLCLYKLILSLNQVVQNWQEKQSSKIYEGLLIFADKDDYLMQKFRYNRESTYSSISNKTKTLNLSMTSITSTSIPIDSRSERFDYFAELFKSFLIDINPQKLRAIRINYKYSRIHTSEFEVEMVEMISIRDQLEGKELLRELLNEINNVAEIYQLLEEHSPLARHLARLQDDIESKPVPTGNRNSKELVLGMETYKTDLKNSSSQRTNKDISLVQRCSEESFEQEASEDKRLFNPQMSQQSSLVGNTESQSKKQLLINAFNSTQSALPSTAVFLAYLSIIFLLILLVFLSCFSFIKINQEQTLWNDSSYVLDLRTNIEFRLALIELQQFSQLLNLSLPATLLNRTSELNKQMVKLVENINLQTINSGPGGPYSYILPLFDPARNITYQSRLPQTLTQLTWLFQEPSSQNIQFLRANYQNIHLSLEQFYNYRVTDLQVKNQNSFQIIKILFGCFQGLLTLTAFCSLPLYIYFKREELTVRSKLAFMSIKEIRKAIARLRLTHDFLRKIYKKGAVSRLQIELSDKKGEKQEEAVNANKFIKITSQAEETKLFKNPILYALLLAFIIFFSNLSVTLFVISTQSDSSFMQTVAANKIINDMEIKTPLLLNTYLANLNNVLQGNPRVNFKSQLISETQTGYFDVMSSLMLPQYSNNRLSMSIESEASSMLCAQINCTINQNFSLTFIANSFKNRFNFWDPSNGITPNLSTITTWTNENGIAKLLAEVQYVLLLSQNIRDYVETQFGNELNSLQLLIIILVSVFIPLNVVAMLVISRRFLNLLNGIIKSAEQIFMHFPVSVLIENTYLTSYFNSKAKHGK